MSQDQRPPKRLHILDALRGFAIVSIMLLHNIEHFDLYHIPTGQAAWLTASDGFIWNSLFFLFGGKSYAIFALLFGLTFHIQLNNQISKGLDFRARFAWRMTLLIGFGIVNTAFYQGDILTFYAIVGFLLIPFAKRSDRIVLWAAVICLLQPFELLNLSFALAQANERFPNPLSWIHTSDMREYIVNGTLLSTMKGNLVNGKLDVLRWSWENGRFFHMLSLFLFGILAGRKGIFVWNDRARHRWIAALVIASLLFVPLWAASMNLGSWISDESIRTPINRICASWRNMSFMVVLLSGFTLLYHTRIAHKGLRLFEPLGKMSLSNYIFQSILGTTLYYDFGLGLYDKTGATYCLLIGLLLASLMALFSAWWMKRFRHGPLEALWHKGTWAFSPKSLPKTSP